MVDKFVEEIHAVRKKICEECDYDFQKLGEYDMRIQKESSAHFVTEVPKQEPAPTEKK